MNLWKIRNDGTNTNELGYEIRNYVEENIDYQRCGFQIKCIKCGKENRTNMDYVYCKECNEFLFNTEKEIFSKKISTMEFLENEIKSIKDIKDTKYDIEEKIEIETDKFYGKLTIKICFEENEWSSTPCDTYIIEGIISSKKLKSNIFICRDQYKQI